MADEVTIHEAKTHLSRLVQRAHAGEEIVIRRGKVPMAKLVRYDAAPVPRVPGRLRGQIEMAPDFDALDDEMGDLFGVGR
jgi:antitoxin (DNA-binding transcriptional repressor) of toxin-antitoxin stability system